MRILIVEDELKVAAFLEKGFKAEAFSVDVAHDGPHGRDLAMANTYDAIILDVMLPGKNGLSILQELRASGNASPILILSAKSQLDDRVEGLNLGADGSARPRPRASTKNDIGE